MLIDDDDSLRPEARLAAAGFAGSLSQQVVLALRASTEALAERDQMRESSTKLARHHKLALLAALDALEAIWTAARRRRFVGDPDLRQTLNAAMVMVRAASKATLADWPVQDSRRPVASRAAREAGVG